jgi:hypothetical protein
MSLRAAIQHIFFGGSLIAVSVQFEFNVVRARCYSATVLWLAENEVKRDMEET